jgi:retron-type reverse transcriptase
LNNDSGSVFGIVLAARTGNMGQETLYQKIYSFDNLFLAYQKSRKGKTRKPDILKFEKDLERNLLDLQFELQTQAYKPLPLTTFSLRDPKTRVISKSDFRDRIVHHAIINVIGPIFEKSFIYDSCANQRGKGNLFAIKRFDKFTRKVSKNFTAPCFVLKADIKHYFQEVNHEILLTIIKRKISEEMLLRLITKILANSNNSGKGMPLGNLTSQFFANVYLHELDFYIKHVLKIKIYIRYVDDFVILNSSRKQLLGWKGAIGNFLQDNLKIELHPQKSRIIPLSRGIDFVGFRNFYYHKQLRARNIRKFIAKLNSYKNNKITFAELFDSYNGLKAHAKWADTFNLRKELKIKIIEELLKNV